MLSLFESVVREKKIPYICIDGSTSQRQRLIDEFNQGSAKVALLSLMGQGLELILSVRIMLSTQTVGRTLLLRIRLQIACTALDRRKMCLFIKS